MRITKTSDRSDQHTMLYNRDIHDSCKHSYLFGYKTVHEMSCTWLYIIR